MEEKIIKTLEILKKTAEEKEPRTVLKILSDLMEDWTGKSAYKHVNGDELGELETLTEALAIGRYFVSMVTDRAILPEETFCDVIEKRCEEARERRFEEALDNFLDTSVVA